MKLLTPLYELLVYLEEYGKVSSEDIKIWEGAPLRGALGKMEAMGLVEKTENQGQKYYCLSPDGFKFLNSILDIIHQKVKHWDGKWRLILSGLPGEKRLLKDQFRKYLESLGSRPILGGLWATPFNYKAEIEDLANQIGLSGRFVLVETEAIQGMSNEQIASKWDFGKPRILYEEFIAKSEELIRSKKVSRYEAKKLILEYALILNNEPNLPIELLPKDWPKFRANLQYKKLKRIISSI